MSQPTKSVTRWPSGMEPGDCPVYAYNELSIRAPADAIWAWLIRAAEWPQWYPNAKRVVIEGERGRDLQRGSVFTWTTFGVRVRTVVEELVPHERLAWSGTGLGARGYHGWVIQPQGDRCRVITEETQRGLVPSIGRWAFRRLLHRYHRIWLDGLARRAENGPPV